MANALNITVGGDISAAVQQFAGYARKVKDAGGETKQLATEIKALNKQFDDAGNSARKADAEFEKLIKDEMQLARVAAEATRANERFEKSQQNLSRGTRDATRDTGTLQVSLSGLSGRLTQMLGPAALVNKAVEFITAALREQTAQAERAAGELEKVQGAYGKVVKATGGDLKASVGVHEQAKRLAVKEGLHVDEALPIVAKAYQEKVGAQPFIQAFASKVIASPETAIDTLATLNAGLSADKQLSSSQFVNQIMAAGLAVGATPDEIVEQLKKAGPQLTRTGTSPAEFIGLAAGVGERTGSGRQALSSVQHLTDVLAGDIDVSATQGKGRKVQLSAAGIAGRVAEFQRLAPQEFAEKLRNDGDFALAVSEVEASQARARSISRSGDDGELLTKANRDSYANVITGQERRTRSAEAGRSVAQEQMGLDEQRYKEVMAQLEAAWTRIGTPWFERQREGWSIGAIRGMSGPGAGAQQAEYYLRNENNERNSAFRDFDNAFQFGPQKTLDLWTQIGQTLLGIHANTAGPVQELSPRDGVGNDGRDTMTY